MDALDAIFGRRSIRHYAPRPVPEEVLNTLLAAAMNAPSAGNEQPWQFVVITDRSLMDGIASYHPYAKMLPEAALAVMVCADLRRQRHEGSWVLDCAAATQNLLLAAHASGLGAVWVGIYPRPDREAKLRELCALPEYIVPVSLVPLGYPGEKLPPVRRFDPARVRHNRW
jgi:nitroreductase